MNFFGDDVAEFKVPQSLIKAVSGASRAYKRKLSDQKAEADELLKRNRLDEEVTQQVLIAKEAEEMAEKEMEASIAEAGTIDRALTAEHKTMSSFLLCLSTTKDAQKIKDLTKELQLSSGRIVTFEDSYKKVQGKILKLQEKKSKK